MIYFLSENIRKTKFLREYLTSFIEGNMYYQTVCQIQLKVMLMSFVANGLQAETIDNKYNNYQLKLRYNDYIIYYRKYNEFKTSNRKVRENTENNYKLKNFTLPSFSGEKINKDIKLFKEDVFI